MPFWGCHMELCGSAFLIRARAHRAEELCQTTQQSATLLGFSNTKAVCQASLLKTALSGNIHMVPLLRMFWATQVIQQKKRLQTQLTIRSRWMLQMAKVASSRNITAFFQVMPVSAKLESTQTETSSRSGTKLKLFEEATLFSHWTHMHNMWQTAHFPTNA